ncbi:MAG: GntR family transcriptional regulator [Pseudomonadota bacterium]
MSATNRAVNELRELIFSATLPPGSDHLEAELAARLGLSRTPVREALARLEAQGLVQIRPRRGARIVGLSPTDMSEIYEVLTALEATAAAAAARRGLSAAELVPMAQAIEAMEDALGEPDLARWAVADDQFHHALVAASGNSRLVEAAGLYADQVRRARMMTLRLRPLPQKSNEDHRAVFAAIRAGDEATAFSVHKAHRERARALLTELLAEYQFPWL